MRLSRMMFAAALLAAASLSAQAQTIQPHGSGGGSRGMPDPSAAQLQPGPGQQGGPGSQAPGGQRPALQSGPGGGTQYFGAIAFTADGSYSTTWQQPSAEAAEAKVLRECARFGRGACEAKSFPGHLCIGLANYRGGRWRLAFTAGGTTTPQAQQAALDSCNSDNRVRSRRGCTLRIAFCGDGR
jgi:hypothetical protein